jgi:cardiolipin synthase
MQGKAESQQVYQINSNRPDLFSPANLLTMARYLMIPVMMFAMIKKPEHAAIIASTAFAAGQLISLFDGYTARRTNNVTSSGQLLDGFANKVLLMNALLLLLNAHILPVIVVFLALSREVYALMLRSISHERNIQLPNSLFTPIKTALQFVAVILLFLSPDLGPEIKMSGMVTMVLSIILAWATAAIYTKGLFSTMRRREQL